MWRIADGALLWENQTESEIECVSYSPDGKYIACGVEDFNVYIRDTESGNMLEKLEHDASLDGLSYSSKGKILATGSEKGTLTTWSTGD